MMKEAVSIIVSSCNEEHYNKFIKSVEKTIGCDYEIVKIVNPGLYSLCEAYNIGIGRAVNPYVCFVHEDVNFLGQNWGVHCMEVMLSDSAIGLIGVAGSAYKSTLPGAWLSTFTRDFCRGKICQGDNSWIAKRWTDYDRRENKTDLSDVVCIDGVFMFTTKNIASAIQFDSVTFTGYHCYDLDFSTAVFLSGYRVVVDREIQLFHYSQGNFNHTFSRYAKLYCRKYRYKLPLCAEKIPLISYVYIELCSWWNYLKHKILK